ncbi:hypothetical protein [Eupransor demetentiae]|uniref:Tubby2 superfamily (YxjI) n=1 Tax=Eupransor demetentiae TaxID=3109584 RepID=A0ABM9N4S9_9LACO|nr:Putative phospholipid scramblase YxjI [Lactobacillaceae bacterium LMG 33000]
MFHYYLRQRYSPSQVSCMAFDAHFQPIFIVTGQSGRIGDCLAVCDLSGNRLVEIQQLSLGVVPRFLLRERNQELSSLTLHLGYVANLIYLRKLNWLITGNFITQNYVTYHHTKKIAAVKPQAQPDGLYDEIATTVSADQLPILIAITALLDIWYLNHDLMSQFLPRQNWQSNIQAEMEVAKIKYD